MKTIGERIRQAREWHSWSGDQLAKKVGYKRQSAIGNLENRAGGNGGNKLTAIAAALNVPVSWLLSGPDTDNIPFLPPKQQPENPNVLSFLARESTPEALYDEDTQNAIRIFQDMPQPDRRGAVSVLRMYVDNLNARPNQAAPATNGTTA